MGRIATAQGGNNPETYRCSLCGMCGHNCRSCTNTRPLPVRGVKKCGCCGEVGHNIRTCKKKKVDEKFEAELALLLADEQPLPQDLVLSPVSTADTEPFPEDLALSATPTPRSETEDLDIITEGYQADWANLPRECVEIILAEVERLNQVWWFERIHPRFGLHSLAQVEFLDSIRSVGEELQQIADIKGYHKIERQTTYTGVRQGVSLQKCLRGSVGTQKGVRKHTWAWKKPNRMSGCPSTYYSWRHTLAERNAILQGNSHYYTNAPW